MIFNYIIIFLHTDKIFSRYSETMDEIVNLCQHRSMKLKHSPPYILDILPDIYLQMKHIQVHVIICIGIIIMIQRGCQT